MKPDTYMPFYGNEFFQAVEGQDELVIVSYMRVIWHYWHHAHCAGLEDNKELLRRLCRVDRDDWERVCAVVFDNDKFFTMDEIGIWRQKRADELWQQQQKNYNFNVERARLGAKVRWNCARRKQ